MTKFDLKYLKTLVEMRRETVQKEQMDYPDDSRIQMSSKIELTDSKRILSLLQYAIDNYEICIGGES